MMCSLKVLFFQELQKLSKALITVRRWPWRLLKMETLLWGSMVVAIFRLHVYQSPFEGKLCIKILIFKSKILEIFLCWTIVNGWRNHVLKFEVLFLWSFYFYIKIECKFSSKKKMDWTYILVSVICASFCMWSVTVCVVPVYIYTGKCQIYFYCI